MSPRKHWLIQHAERMPLSNCLHPASTTLVWMFVGALDGTAKPIGRRAKASDFARLMKAHADAQEVLRHRENALAVLVEKLPEGASQPSTLNTQPPLP